MGRHKKPFMIIACVLAICLTVLYLKACRSCLILDTPMNIPSWVTYPKEFRNLKGLILGRSCPESWPWSEKKITKIWIGILDHEEKFYLEWQKVEIVGALIEVKVMWKSSEQFNVIFIEKGYPTSERPYDKKLIKEGPRIVLRLTYIYYPLEKKYKLVKMIKGENKLVKMI